MTKTKSTQAQAAAMIRAYCKQHGIKAEVRSSSFAGGNDVTCVVTDLETDRFKALASYVKQFQYGTFDGMTDYYSADNRRADLPQVKFAFCERRFSEEAMQRAWTFAIGYYADSQGFPALLEDARRANVRDAAGYYADQIARKALCDGKVA